ncbi:hypothetical protein EMCG_04914 [[Emmonsia] crescens]|uniref:Altered inheritance of mitochondria protein 9, mitochondrial n=1 Tax=[Emmonsia] crescens TaxID=73230 RepID=A0A0G2J6U9_9EURO|nr:hypothetical protein EMCG_04914 [Emmonsia crescens UAMH 3008]
MATSAPCEKELFEYTRGRFLLDEASQMARRRVHFNMSELASVAAKSVGAKQCVDIEKCPDGLFNKAYILTMDSGKQVIGKVPNPNAGIPYYTIASEVATMDFARNVLGTPTPHVYAWDGCRSGVGSNSVGAEFIIMERVPGVSLASLWWKLELGEKLKILLQVASFQKRWVEVQFTKFGSLYFAESTSFRGGESQMGVVGNPRFVIGPAVGREWSDEGRQNVQCDRGPWDSIVSYRKAIAL